ncbi:hypothetical protein Vafri_10572, partial [Volvox africanus]
GGGGGEIIATTATTGPCRARRRRSAAAATAGAVPCPGVHAQGDVSEQQPHQTEGALLYPGGWVGAGVRVDVSTCRPIACGGCMSGSRRRRRRQQLFSAAGAAYGYGGCVVLFLRGFLGRFVFLSPFQPTLQLLDLLALLLPPPPPPPHPANRRHALRLWRRRLAPLGLQLGGLLLLRPPEPHGRHGQPCQAAECHRGGRGGHVIQMAADDGAHLEQRLGGKDHLRKCDRPDSLPPPKQPRRPAAFEPPPLIPLGGAEATDPWVRIRRGRQCCYCRYRTRPVLFELRRFLSSRGPPDSPTHPLAVGTSSGNPVATAAAARPPSARAEAPNPGPGRHPPPPPPPSPPPPLGRIPRRPDPPLEQFPPALQGRPCAGVYPMRGGSCCSGTEGAAAPKVLQCCCCPHHSRPAPAAAVAEKEREKMEVARDVGGLPLPALPRDEAAAHLLPRGHSVRRHCRRFPPPTPPVQRGRSGPAATGR